MGFFGDMGAIRKLYKKLESIEQDMINIEKCNQGILNPLFLSPAFSSITSNLQEMMDIVDRSSATVQNADFQFCGRKLPIRVHMLNIAEYLREQMENF
ncbi:MAG: hypothetical protein K2K64_04410 [Muribaculaceae bacterium]|nr:hypothetical protein [Muribaculaceae bacterium]